MVYSKWPSSLVPTYISYALWNVFTINKAAEILIFTWINYKTTSAGCLCLMMASFVKKSWSLLASLFPLILTVILDLFIFRNTALPGHCWKVVSILSVASNEVFWRPFWVKCLHSHFSANQRQHERYLYSPTGYRSCLNCCSLQSGHLDQTLQHDQETTKPSCGRWKE